MNENDPVTAIGPRHIDFGGFPVRRFLPSREFQGVGPWVFFDHLGPKDFPPGGGIDVIPHPHINLATVTYLFDGIITHRDSLGNVQDIGPGAVNLMVAGRGIAHSERTPAAARRDGHRVHGLQLWHALPDGDEETAPSFHHYGAEEIPEVSIPGGRVRVLIGGALGVQSPVRTFLPTLFLEVRLEAGAVLTLTEDLPGAAIYPVTGRVRADGAGGLAGGRGAGGTEAPGERMLIRSGATVVEALSETHLVVIGGTSPGERYMWWNFVSSRPERIAEARRVWEAGGFPRVTADTQERAAAPVTDRHSRMPG